MSINFGFWPIFDDLEATWVPQTTGEIVPAQRAGARYLEFAPA
jgi:hypothetical protein